MSPTAIRRSVSLGAILCLALFGLSRPALALEPPTPAQLQAYRTKGILPQLITQARALRNDQVSPRLARHLHLQVRRLVTAPQGQPPGRLVPAPRPIPRPTPAPMPPSPAPSPAPMPEGWSDMPSTGNVKVLALLIAFKDYAPTVTADTVRAMLFGDGNAANFPNESLRNYYSRSSGGQLVLSGNVLGWYTTSYNRSSVVETGAGRQQLIKEALQSYDATHDFSQYDNDGDGKIDYMVVMWTGPAGAWATFWWGYQTGYSDASFKLDGKSLSTYSWQWQSSNPTVVIHETGHALGLPDLYDYDDSVGPRGGVGGLDPMHSNRGDHNCFSKMLLGWLTPTIAYNADRTYTLRAQSAHRECALVIPGCDPRFDDDEAFSEYYVVENRTRVATANDATMPGDGLLIWHIDARLDTGGGFQYNNSYTDHKLVRVMEADGLEHIEAGQGGHAADYWGPGKIFSATSTPKCGYYGGTDCRFQVAGIATPAESMTARIAYPIKSELICIFRRFQQLRAVCRTVGCRGPYRPWEEYINPGDRFERIVRGDPVKAAKLRDLKARAEALAARLERARPEETARIEQQSKGMLDELKALGVSP